MRAETKIIDGFTLTIIKQIPVSYKWKHLIELSFYNEAIGTILIPREEWEDRDKLKALISKVIYVNSYGYTDYLMNSTLTQLVDQPSKRNLVVVRYGASYHIKVTDKRRLLKIFQDKIIVEGRLVEMVDMDNQKFADLSFYQYSKSKGLKPIGWMYSKTETFSDNDLLKLEIDKVKHAKENNEGYEFTLGSHRYYYFFDDDGYTFSVNGGTSERVQFEETGGNNA